MEENKSYLLTLEICVLLLVVALIMEMVAIGVTDTTPNKISFN